MNRTLGVLIIIKSIIYIYIYWKLYQNCILYQNSTNVYTLYMRRVIIILNIKHCKPNDVNGSIRLKHLSRPRVVDN